MLGEAAIVTDKALAIRSAREEDAAALVSIYEPYVLNTAITFEYTVPSVEEFAGRIRSTLKKYPYLVAELDGEVVGYAYASSFKDRAAYAWAVETSIYLRMDMRGKGVGGRLYRALEDALMKMGVLNLNACIGYPNPESVGFHERLGYKIVGHFSKCGYKLNAWHDVVWMEKFIGEHDVPPAGVTPFSMLSQA
jgi:L-amino acid N-acyltransferase YncA